MAKCGHYQNTDPYSNNKSLDLVSFLLAVVPYSSPNRGEGGVNYPHGNLNVSKAQ